MKSRVWFAVVGLVVVGLVMARACGGPDWPEHEGELRQVVRASVENVRRGGQGTLRLASVAMYTPKGADEAIPHAFLGWKSTQLSLVGAGQESFPVGLAPEARVGAGEKGKWHDAGAERAGVIVLPDVPDGDYRLRILYETVLGKGELEVPLALYSPARVHVITDRPLYEPGNLMKFRAVVLRARDLAPLDGRPGRWIVTDPSGEVMLEEEAPAGNFGVVSGSFPIDKNATPGTWKVKWASADASSELAVRVEPFTLPRFHVSAETPRPYYRVGDEPVITGAVSYSSGAPVARAELSVNWHFEGEWEPPTEWTHGDGAAGEAQDDGLLPTRGVTNQDGRFELKLPRVPRDLKKQVRMNAHITAIDAAKERVQGLTTVLLSEDAIQAEVVTELGDRLAQGFNNRMYVRVTTADGRALPGTKIKVQRSPHNDRGIEAVTDEDGVASLQVDPGPPLNIVIPPMPFRPPPAPPPVTRDATRELLSGQVSVADQLAMDSWLAPLASCGKWGHAHAPVSVVVGLRVSESGAISGALGDVDDPLRHCVLGGLRGRKLPSGRERMYSLTFNFAPPELPSLSAQHEGVFGVPQELQDQIRVLAAGARDCLPRDVEGKLPELLSWRVTRERREVAFSWHPDPNGEAMASAVRCVKSRFGGRTLLDASAVDDAMGVVRFTVHRSPASLRHQPQPTTRMGYEFTITAESEGLPSTKVIVSPGTIPDLRMRVTPVLAAPGESVTAELIRGPGFAGELPKELSMDCAHHSATAKLDDERKAKLKLPGSVEGFCQINGGGVRGLVYVKPASELRVNLASDQPRYAPGQEAKISVQTLIGGQGAPAAVGLFGVDESLAQLATLPGPGDMQSVQPRVETLDLAFRSLDGQALVQGRIRGANAAAATILRVREKPVEPEPESALTAHAETPFDAVAELTDRFYAILPELYAQARAWEERAKPTEKMKPATMAELWDKALAACEARKERVQDAYGRRLRLSILPPDLLALTAPHAVVGGTRVPEDVENWAAWVKKEGR